MLHTKKDARTYAGGDGGAALLVALGAAVAGDAGDTVLAGTLARGLVAGLAGGAHGVTVALCGDTGQQLRAGTAGTGRCGIGKAPGPELAPGTGAALPQPQAQPGSRSWQQLGAHPADAAPHPVRAEIGSLQEFKAGQQHPPPPASSPDSRGGGRAGTEAQTRQGSTTPPPGRKQSLGNSFHVRSKKNQSSPFRPSR